MKEELFNELVESIKEAGAYLRGEQTTARVTVICTPERAEQAADPAAGDGEQAP